MLGTHTYDALVQLGMPPMQHRFMVQSLHKNAMCHGIATGPGPWSPTQGLNDAVSSICSKSGWLDLSLDQ